jgi:hypothetical protein
MNELSITENLIAEYRSNYNKQVKEYNRYIRKFPTRFFLYTITPEDCTVELNRFFKEENDEFVEITKAEYDMRKHCHGCFGAANNDCLRCEEELQYESE